MDDESTIEGADTEPDTEPGPNTEPTPNHDAEIAKWKAMARKHETEAKKNAEAAARLRDLENAGKSETEKLQAALNEAQTAARSSRVQALRLQVAAEKGLPPGLAKFLPDLDDEVDMLAAADELLEAAGRTGTAEVPSRQPRSAVTNPLGDDNAESQHDRVIAAMLGQSI